MKTNQTGAMAGESTKLNAELPALKEQLKRLLEEKQELLKKIKVGDDDFVGLVRDKSVFNLLSNDEASLLCDLFNVNKLSQTRGRVRAFVYEVIENAVLNKPTKIYLNFQSGHSYRSIRINNVQSTLIIDKGNDAPKGGKLGEYVLVKFNLSAQTIDGIKRHYYSLAQMVAASNNELILKIEHYIFNVRKKIDKITYHQELENLAKTDNRVVEMLNDMRACNTKSSFLRKWGGYIFKYISPNVGYFYDLMAETKNNKNLKL